MLMVGSFFFALKSRLAGIAGRNKPLINMKAHLQRCAFCFAFIWFRVQGSGLTSRPLETEVPQRDFRVWPNPKRRLACPLRRLPVRPNGPRRRRRIDPRSGVKNYVGLSVSLKRHPDRSGGIER